MKKKILSLFPSEIVKQEPEFSTYIDWYDNCEINDFLNCLCLDYILNLLKKNTFD